jgi:hypothetical protein
MLPVPLVGAVEVLDPPLTEPPVADVGVVPAGDDVGGAVTLLGSVDAVPCPVADRASDGVPFADPALPVLAR